MLAHRWGNPQSVAEAENFVLLDVDGESGVATITLNRPDKRNALSVPMRDRILDLIQLLDSREDVHVVVFRGNGPSFCSGNEINEDWGQRGPDYRRFTVTHAYRYSSELSWGRQSFSQAIARSPKVTISAVHGYCAAAAYFLIAAKTDVVIASEDAQIGALEARFLGPASSVASLHLNRIIGTKATRFTGYTGSALSGDDAQCLGLASQVSKPEELDAEVHRIARAISSAHDGRELRQLKAKMKLADSLMGNNVPVMSGLLASHFLQSHDDEHSFWKTARQRGVSGALREDKRRADRSPGESQ